MDSKPRLKRFLHDVVQPIYNEANISSEIEIKLTSQISVICHLFLTNYKHET